MSRFVVFNGVVRYKPGGITKINASALNQVLPSENGIVAISGEAEGGAPGLVSGIVAHDDASRAVSEFKSGPLVDAIRLAFQSSNDPDVPGGASRVLIYKTNQSTPSTVSLPSPEASFVVGSLGTPGVVDSGSTTTIVDAALIGQFADDELNGKFVVLRPFTATAEVRVISDYVDSTGTITVSPAFSTTSAISNEYWVLDAESYAASAVSGSGTTVTWANGGLTVDAHIGRWLFIQNTVTSTDTYLVRVTDNDATTLTVTPALPTLTTGAVAQILANSVDLTTTLNTDGSLKIDNTDIFFVATWTNTTNLGIIKVVKLGDVQAVEVGPLDQPINTITQIVTSRLGWDSVMNPIAAVPGRLRETDQELRIRFRNTKFERAGNIVEAVYSALFSLDDVEQVFIDDNNTDVVNENGTPGHSFLVLVDGGTSVEIARAIWDNRGAGVASVGNTTVMITDKYGYQREIKFSRPTPVNIYIKLDITIDQNFPENGYDLIKQAIIDYVNSLSIGQDIIYSRLYTPINSVPGHQVNSMLIGKTSPPTGVNNIVTMFDEVGQVLPENITFV